MRPRIGLYLIVLRPEVEAAEESLPGPLFRILQPIQVVEHPMLNRGTRGTRITCGAASLRVLRSLHPATIGPATAYADKKPIMPFAQVPDGFRSAVVSVMFTPPHEVVAKPGNVLAEIDDAGKVTLSAPDGAQIWWTRDGSYPAWEGMTSSPAFRK